MNADDVDSELAERLKLDLARLSIWLVGVALLLFAVTIFV